GGSGPKCGARGLPDPSLTSPNTRRIVSQLSPSHPGRVQRMRRTPKIPFVNPRFPKSLWGFQGMYDLIGVRSGQAPLGLMTGAALTPPEIAVELIDENCYPLSYEADADVIAIGCWNVQYRRAREIAA